MTCVEKIIEKLSELPAEWREQIACVICDTIVNDVKCEEVKKCETLTSLSVFSVSGNTVSITYKDEAGVSHVRSFNMATAMSLSAVDPKCLADKTVWQAMPFTQQIQTIVNKLCAECPPPASTTSTTTIGTTSTTTTAVPSTTTTTTAAGTSSTTTSTTLAGSTTTTTTLPISSTSTTTLPTTTSTTTSSTTTSTTIPPTTSSTTTTTTEEPVVCYRYQITALNEPATVLTHDCETGEPKSQYIPGGAAALECSRTEPVATEGEITYYIEEICSEPVTTSTSSSSTTEQPSNTIAGSVSLSCNDSGCTQQGSTSLNFTFNQPTPTAIDLVFAFMLMYQGSGAKELWGSNLLNDNSIAYPAGATPTTYDWEQPGVPYKVHIPAGTTSINIPGLIHQDGYNSGSSGWICHSCQFPVVELWSKIKNNSTSLLLNLNVTNSGMVLNNIN